MLKIDGFGPAIIGQCCCWVGDERVDRIVYDGHTILGMLIGDGMESDEALEYIEYNIEGAYVGKDTPIIVWNLDDD